MADVHMSPTLRLAADIEAAKRRFNEDHSGPLLNIVFEDEDLIVVNKPAGLVVHPTRNGELSSLVGRLRLYFDGAVKPQFINRLDRETSGLVVVAKNEVSAYIAREIWAKRDVMKKYRAIVRGHVADDARTIDAPLGKHMTCAVAIRDHVRPDGSPSVSRFETLRRFTRAEGDFSLLSVDILTGRKHQIRIHFEHIGHPIVGDKIYGGDEQCYLSFIDDTLTEEQLKFLILPYQALHAAETAFEWSGERLHLRAEPEPWFLAFLEEGVASPETSALT